MGGSAQFVGVSLRQSVADVLPQTRAIGEKDIDQLTQQAHIAANALLNLVAIENAARCGRFLDRRPVLGWYELVDGFP